MSDAYRYTAHYVSEAYHYVAHHAARAWHAVKRAYHAAAHFVKTAYHKVATAARRVVHAVASAARTAYHAATQAVAAAAKYAKAHAAAITSFVVSTAVFMGCEAATSGVGTVGCAALSGAAGSLVTQGFKCADSGGDACSLGAFAEAGLEGGIEGAAGGALGELGSGLLASVGGKALDGVGGLFGRGAEDAAGEAGDEIGSAEAGSATSSADGGGAGGSGGGEPEAGAEDNAGESCPAAHSFTGSTRVLMADGTSKPIDQVRAGDKIADSVPGEKGTQSHTVSKVIITKTDHDFVDVTIAPVKAGAAAAVKKTAKRAGSVLGSAARSVKSKAKLGLAAAVALGAVAAGGQPAMAATGTPAHVTAKAQATATASARGGTITTTFHHPFYDETQAAFVEAQYLHAGDVLQTPTGTAKVTAVRLFHANTVTYDLTIGTLHTYYVEAGDIPLLVHNLNYQGCRVVNARFAATRSGTVTDVDEGPGRWMLKDSEKALASRPSGQYQEQITKMPAGWVYGLGGKAFDGFDSVDGAVLDAKGEGYEKLFGAKWAPTEPEKTIADAMESLGAAGDTPFRMVFAERGAMDAVRAALPDAIDLVHIPPA